MSKYASTIRTAIEANLHSKGISAALIRIDGYLEKQDVQVFIISTGFSNLSIDQRNQYVFEDVDISKVEWYELLTPKEAEWAGLY